MQIFQHLPRQQQKQNREGEDHFNEYDDNEEVKDTVEVGINDILKQNYCYKLCLLVVLLYMSVCVNFHCPCIVQ